MEFMSSINATLKFLFPLLLVLPLQTNDICLMKVLNNLPKISTTAIASFNQTRLFLCVMYLSEMCDTSGSYILNKYWHAQGQSLQGPLYSYQPPPTDTMIHNWQNGLTKLFYPKT